MQGKKILQDLLCRLHCGQPSLQMSIVVDGAELSPDLMDCTYLPEKGRAIIHCEYGKSFTDDLYLEFAPEAQEPELKARRIFRNVSGSTQRLNEMCASISGITFGQKPIDDYFYHVENPRIYAVMTFPVDYDRTAENAKDPRFDIATDIKEADPEVIHKRIGYSPYQTFPAILLSNYGTNKGLVHGTLSQECCFHNYLLEHEDGTVTMRIFSSFKDVAALEMQPGRFIEDDWYLGTIDQAQDIEQLFAKYLAVLRKVLPPMHGSGQANRHSVVWGSWNDGIFRKISEEMLLEEARFLKGNFPTVEWIQVDDGYAKRVPPAHGLGMPYEGNAGLDWDKFPQGMRHFTDEVRLLGLRPAIWIGGLCPDHTPIYQEHPEWFIDCDYRMHPWGWKVLDVSNPQVREYMSHALDVLILEYGYDAVKHDFWSYAFETSKDLFLADKTRSGYEWRDWWLKEFWKRLPEDGYMQTGCDLMQGNPFMGQFFNNYRYGMDVGPGSWESTIFTFKVATSCLSNHIGDLIVPNSDSIGLLPGLDDTGFKLCINFTMVTRSNVELAGRLSQTPDHPRMKVLKKALCCPNNGDDVHFAKYDYRNSRGELPALLYFNTPHFCYCGGPALPLRTFALFNLKEETQTLGIKPEELKLPDGKYIVTDVWSGETFSLDGELTFELKPHDSRLLAVNEDNGLQILDANFKMDAVFFEDGALCIKNDYAMDAAELHLSKPAKSISFNGVELPCTMTGNMLVFDLPSPKGIIKVQE